MNWNEHELTHTDYSHSSGEVVKVAVSKVGGGTLGNKYEGKWHYTYIRGSIMRKGSDLNTGPKTHQQVADLVMGFYKDR